MNLNDLFDLSFVDRRGATALEFQGRSWTFGEIDERSNARGDVLEPLDEARLIKVAKQLRELGVKVTVLHEGSVIAEGSIDQVSANERVIEVYLGR